VNFEQNEFSPILAQREYLGRKAEPITAHVAHVLVTSKGEHRTVWPHDRKNEVVWQHTSRSGLLKGKVKTVYDVDLGVRYLRFPADLPGAGDSFSFKAEAAVEWRVLDPSLVVRSQLRDVRMLVQPAVVDAMRRIAREYQVDQSSVAERALNEALVGEALDFNDLAQLDRAMQQTASTGHIGREYGLWTRTTVSVQPDQSRLAQSDEMRNLKHQIETERLKQELRILQEQNNQQVMAGRMSFYRDAFSSGDIDRAVLQIAQNPDDLASVAQMIRDQEMSGQRLTIDFVNKLMESGAIERWQINDQAKAALDWLRQSTNVVFTPPRAGAAEDQGGGSRRRTRANPMPELGPADGIAIEPAPADEGPPTQFTSVEN
jgi:hypothetical protein